RHRHHRRLARLPATAEVVNAVSLVVPTLNEESRLPLLLASAAKQTRPFHEIVVSDGGSADATRSVAEKAGAKVVVCSRGRGLQIATGIEVCTGQIMLVLHADAVCDPRTTERIQDHFDRVPDS